MPESSVNIAVRGDRRSIEMSFAWPGRVQRTTTEVFVTSEVYDPITALLSVRTNMLPSPNATPQTRD